MTRRTRRARRARRARGFTYVEVLLAIVILAGGVTSMGFALESSRVVAGDSADARVALYLVQDGIAWASSLARRDPESPSSFGPESGEAFEDFDDVDDLRDTLENPPTDRAGDQFDAKWSREFKVHSVSPASPHVEVTPGSSNLMRVRVRVWHAGAVVATDSVLLWRKP